MDKDKADDNSPQRKSGGRDYDAYAVRNDREGNGHFHKIGAAFAHKDGEGFDIDMVATPTNGRLTLRTPKDRLDQQREQSTKSREQGQRRSRRRDQERER